MFIVGLGQTAPITDHNETQCQPAVEAFNVPAEATLLAVTDMQKRRYVGAGSTGRRYQIEQISNRENTSLPLLSIEPDQQQVIMGNHRSTFAALRYMGQSWSKPSLGYINWQGQPKLVFFVGGGYDAIGTVNCRDTRFQDQGYWCPHYNPALANGAGIYMFDAQNGALLWWASANATQTLGATQATYHAALKYSVVAQINTIDRDADGLVDTLYFADLGGQVFRVDLNNQVRAEQSLVKRIVKILDVHQEQGASPRFYHMPSVSIHLQSNQQTPYVSIILHSGHPLIALNEVETNKYDGLFAVYDYDLGRPDLYSTKQLNTESVKFDQLVRIESMDNALKNNPKQYGWWYPYQAPIQQAEVNTGIGNIIVMNNVLYAHVYRQTKQNLSLHPYLKQYQNDFKQGQTYLYRLCLPGQICLAQNLSPSGVEQVLLGGGMITDHFSWKLKQETWRNILLNGLFNIQNKICQSLNQNQCLQLDMQLQRLNWTETQPE